MLGVFGKKKVKMVLSVEGMMCSHCAAKVEKGLLEKKGVKTVEVDLAAKRVTVLGAGFEAAELISTVKGLGFNVTSCAECERED